MATAIYMRLKAGEYSAYDLEQIAEASQEKRYSLWVSYCKRLDEALKEGPQAENWKRFKAIPKYRKLYLEPEERSALYEESETLARALLVAVKDKIPPDDLLPACKTEYPKEGTVYNRSRTCQYYNRQLFDALADCYHYSGDEDNYTDGCWNAQDILNKVGCDGGYIGWIRSLREKKGHLQSIGPWS